MKPVTFHIRGRKVPGSIGFDSNDIWLKFRFNRSLINEIKAMKGARWHPELKAWSVTNCGRNIFNLKYLLGQNPYEKFDAPIDPTTLTFTRPLREHQKEMVAGALKCKAQIWACEMGLGKTLAAIEVAERLKEEWGLTDNQIWYVGPKNGIVAVSYELRKWGARFQPLMTTYEKLVRMLEGWDGSTPPRVFIVDESSKVKNPLAQRSRAVKHVADAMREEWGEDNCCIILMSGTPAPRTPADWWHQAEIACPGFIREGTYQKFIDRLALREESENAYGGTFKKIITWWDDENKCRICGKLKSEHYQNDLAKALGEIDNITHQFEPSVNEVSKLYNRLKGLVLVKFKKDCLDLPEKQYIELEIKPTAEVLQLAHSIAQTAPRAITALTLLRELSDGIQYLYEGKPESVICTKCEGAGIIDGVLCETCAGGGVTYRKERSIKYIETPKDEYFKNYLDEYEDVGRFIVWAAFSATLDKLVQIATDKGWYVLKVDGRGYNTYVPAEHIDHPTSDELLKAMDRSHPEFDAYRRLYPKVCFAGHPKAGGMALTLTASPIEVFYSNDFSGEARIQAEDRAHRIGMDDNRGLLIVDFLHLPTDRLVLTNLKKKKWLQALTMAEVLEAMENESQAR